MPTPTIAARSTSPSVWRRCLAVGALVAGCNGASTHPPVYAADVGPSDAPRGADAPEVADVPDAADAPEVADVPDAATLDALAADVPADVPAVDAADAPDVVSTIAPGNHPLTTASEVVELFTLHELTGSSIRSVVDRLHQDGAAACPGALVRSGGFYTGDFAAACHTDNRGLVADLGGTWHLRYTDVCGTMPPQLRTSELSTSAVTVRGTADGLAADLAFDATFGASTDTGRSDYLWEGTSRWTAVPEEWLPSTHQFFDGRTVRGVAVTRAGSDAEGYRFTGLIGTTEPGADAGAERTVSFETPEPIRFDAIPTCFHPTAGRLVLHGAVDVVIRFASGASCVPPTWTRDGVAMGDIPIAFYGDFTLCGSASP